jgi:hypothetical protein
MVPWFDERVKKMLMMMGRCAVVVPLDLGGANRR